MENPLEVWTKYGGKRVELLCPIKVSGIDITFIDIKPVQLDHVVRWGSGKIDGSLALLAELSDRQEIELRMLTYPDVDRVFAAFLSMLPDAISNTIDRGKKIVEVPQATDEVAAPIDQPFDDKLTGG